MNWKKSTTLGLLAFSLGCTAISATIAPSAVLAAPALDSKAVYHQFQTYRTAAAKSPASLIKARNYLMKHIDKVSRSQATLMTLQLENMQNARIAVLDYNLSTDSVQQALSQAHEKIGYEENLTYSNLIKGIKAPAVRKLLQETYDLGFKIETSEGLYYPIINYEAYKKFKPYIQSDIAAYIDIMADESNQMTTADAGIVIPWSDVIQRALNMEAFLNKYPKSNRATVVRSLPYVEFLFYGSDNTLVYNYTEAETRILDPEVKKAYEKALTKRGPNTKSILLDTIEQILPVLHRNNGELTPEVKKIIDPVLEQFTPGS